MKATLLVAFVVTAGAVTGCAEMMTEPSPASAPVQQSAIQSATATSDCFADRIVAHSPLALDEAPAHNLLGAPDGLATSFNDDGAMPGFVIAEITNRALVDGAGPDLAIHLVDFSLQEDERFEALVSLDGHSFVSLGVVVPTEPEPDVPRTILLDLAGTGVTTAAYVKILNATVQGHVFEGPDLDAIEALNCSSSRYPGAPGCYADRVVAHTNPTPLPAASVLGVPDLIVTQFDNDGADPGFVLVEFTDDLIVDGSGADLAVHLIDFYTAEQHDESFAVLVSSDGIRFVSLAIVQPTFTEANVPQTIVLDLAGTGLDNGRFVKVVNRTVSSTVDFEGPDLDAFEALNCAPSNRPPSADAGGPYTGTEGAAVAFVGTGSTDPDGDPLTYAWDFGDGATATGAKPDHAYADDGNYTVTLTVSDAVNPAVSASTTVVVTNVPPTVSALPRATLIQTETYAADGSFTDPGADRWTAHVDWGDNGGAEPLALSGKTFALAHIYALAGTFALTIGVRDDDGDIGESRAVVAVLTTAQAAHALVEAIEKLAAEGSLKPGNATALTSKIRAAEAALERGNPTAGAKQLEAFIRDVEALALGRQVEASVAQALIGQARRILDALRRLVS